MMAAGEKYDNVPLTMTDYMRDELYSIGVTAKKVFYFLYCSMSNGERKPQLHATGGMESLNTMMNSISSQHISW